MSTWTDVDMYTDSAFCKGAISVHVDKKGYPGPRGSTWTGITRDKGAQIAPSQKALSAPLSSSRNRRRESLASVSFPRVGVGERHRGREEEGGDGVAIFDRARGAYARETEERRCGGVTGARSGNSQEQQRSSGTWRHLRGGGTWRKNNAAQRAEERISGNEGGGGAEAKAIYTRIR
ncbi:hypothetical protein Scep_005159 [Stephania cephalantha]|uniref:Uncharacterized protein n=1 Tax=Stephania cephalantha TaxID=152367 RepID=A0AAP0KUP5_9MAGN